MIYNALFLLAILYLFDFIVFFCCFGGYALGQGFFFSRIRNGGSMRASLTILFSMAMISSR